MNVKRKNIAAMIFAAAALAGAGLALGGAAGRSVLTGMYRGKISLLSLLYMPAGHYYEASSLLNSSSEFDRITGYYALSEGIEPEISFLREQYSKETSSSVRSVILWLMTINGNRESAKAAIKILSEKAAGDELKSLNEALEKIEASESRSSR